MRLTALAREFVLPMERGLFESCHASSIVELPGGGLLVAYFAGRREGEGDTAIWLSRWQAGRWHAPVRTCAESRPDALEPGAARARPAGLAVLQSRRHGP